MLPGGEVAAEDAAGASPDPHGDPGSGPSAGDGGGAAGQALRGAHTALREVGTIVSRVGSPAVRREQGGSAEPVRSEREGKRWKQPESDPVPPCPPDLADVLPRPPLADSKAFLSSHMAF